MSNAGGFKSLTRYYDMLAGNTVWNPWEPAGAYESIAAVTVPSGGLASVTFNSIPQNYAHLQVRVLARSTVATTQDNALFTVNSNTSSSYAFHYLFGTGSGSAQSGAATSQTRNLLDGEPGTSIATGIFAASILDIIDYSSNLKFKTTRVLSGWDGNGSGNMALHSGFLQNTNSITSITFFNSGSFAQHSQFALYGIKG